MGNKKKDLPYRRCVGIMVLNESGLVWTGHRKVDRDSEMSGTAQLWQMPQGGIDKGEEPLNAAKREIYEEAGIENLALLAEAPSWINYDLPADRIGITWGGKYRGQTQKWFAFRFAGNDSEIRINPPPDGHKAEFDEWAWKPMNLLPELVVPFKRKVYEEVVAAFAHLVR